MMLESQQPMFDSVSGPAQAQHAQHAADEAYELSIARGLSPAEARRAAEDAHIAALTTPK